MQITFKKASFEDIEFINKIRNIYAKDFLHDSNVYSLEEAKIWFLNKNPDYYLIILNLNEKIGYFRTSNYSADNKNIYIGADLHPDYIGKNLAHESYNKFIDFIFKKYNLNKISLEVLSTNQRAIKLYKKLNFFIEGTKRQEVIKNGQFVDSIVMSILKQDWKIKNE